jgi:hypothetical protein
MVEIGYEGTLVSTSMQLSARAVLLLSAVVLAPACGVEGEPVGVAEQAALNYNGLQPAALSPGVLTSSVLTSAALSAGTLAPAALSAIQDPGSLGDLARQLLLYEVGCAFDSTQQLSFSWTDTGGVLHQESYAGSLGLAPEWATQALEVSGQQWVSACLAARVNGEGATVPLSLRGASPALATTPAEAAAYPMREAAFFGNLFTGTPAVYACYDVLVLLAALEKRVCAEPLGGVSTAFDCGPIQILGPCVQILGLLTVGYCTSQDPTYQFYYGCSPPGASAAIPSITTFLQSPL